MTTRGSFGFLLAGVAALVLSFVSSLKADACAGDHGIYTNVLCVGDHMTGEGAYIISPDGHWRLYVSAGTLSPTYDVGQPDEWSWTLIDDRPYADVYGVEVVPFGSGGELRAYDSSYNDFWYGRDANLGSNELYYISMDNSGCVYARTVSDSDDGHQCP